MPHLRLPRALPAWFILWFKLHLNGVKSEFGVDFDSLIYGTGAGSVCNGGDGAMAACEMHR